MPRDHPPRALAADLPENSAFRPALAGREQLQYYLRLRGQPVGEADALLAKGALRDAASRRIGTYSKGMRQRIGHAQAQIGDPRLMILDERASGLDPVSRREFYGLLVEVAAQGTAILLSSHALSELEARTDRIVILSKRIEGGRGQPAGVAGPGRRAPEVSCNARAGQAGALRAALPDAVEAGLVLTCASQDKLAALEKIAAQRPLITDVVLHAVTLDDLYDHISQSQDRKGAVCCFSLFWPRPRLSSPSPAATAAPLSPPR